MLNHASELSVISPALLEAIDAIKVLPTSKSSIDYGATKTAPETLRNLGAALRWLDPDCAYPDWFRICAIVHYETQGSEEGFTVFDTWSGMGQKYKSQRETRRLWGSIRAGHERPLTIGTLFYMLKAAGHDWRAIVSEAESPFNVVDGEGQ